MVYCEMKSIINSCQKEGYPCKDTSLQRCLRNSSIISRINRIRKIIPLKPNMSLWNLHESSRQDIHTNNITSLLLLLISKVVPFQQFACKPGDSHMDDDLVLYLLLYTLFE